MNSRKTAIIGTGMIASSNPTGVSANGTIPPNDPGTKVRAYPIRRNRKCAAMPAQRPPIV